MFILDESIIRGIEGKAVNDEDAKELALYAENKHSFILSTYFYERFNEFETYGGLL